MGAPSRGAPWRAGGCKSLNGSGRSGGPGACAPPSGVRWLPGVHRRACLRVGRQGAPSQAGGRARCRAARGAGGRLFRAGPSCAPRVPPACCVCIPLCRARSSTGRLGGSCETHVRGPCAPCCPAAPRTLCRAVVPGCAPLPPPASLRRPLRCPLLPLAALAFFRGRAHTHTHTPRAPRARPAPGALRARPSGDRGALRRTGAPRRVVSPGGGRGATGHGAGARGRAGREAGCALRGGQRRAPGRGGAALPGRATAGLAARGGRSSRTGPPCSGPGASRVKLTCLTTV